MYGAWMFEQRPHSAADAPICSARGCRTAATTDLQWRNPRLHDAARVKHWLACDEHADQLADFLSRRGFLLARENLIRSSPLPTGFDAESDE